MFCLEKDELTSLKEKNGRNGEVVGLNLNDEGMIIKSETISLY